MNLNYFLIEDLKAGGFPAKPYESQSIPTMVRQLTDEVNRNEDSMLSRYPEDYVLWHIATYNSEKGQMETFEPVKLGNLKGFKRETT